MTRSISPWGTREDFGSTILRRHELSAIYVTNKEVHHFCNKLKNSPKSYDSVHKSVVHGPPRRLAFITAPVGPLNQATTYKWPSLGENCSQESAEVFSSSTEEKTCLGTGSQGQRLESFCRR